MKLVNLETMQYVDGPQLSIFLRIKRQKVFVATRKGVELLLHRLLKGTQEHFDTSMCERIRANVAMRDEWPMAGSRAHYSLVDGGKEQEEQMPKQGCLAREQIP